MLSPDNLTSTDDFPSGPNSLNDTLFVFVGPMCQSARLVNIPKPKQTIPIIHFSVNHLCAKTVLTQASLSGLNLVFSLELTGVDPFGRNHCPPINGQSGGNIPV